MHPWIFLFCSASRKSSNLFESGTGRRPTQGLYIVSIMPNNSKRSRSNSRAGCGPWSYDSLLCLLHRQIVLTLGTGQRTSRSVSAPHQGGQQTVVVSGATASQAPRAGSSALPQRIAASSHYVQRVPGRLHFWRKNLPLSF